MRPTLRPVLLPALAVSILAGCLSLGGEPVVIHRHALDPIPAVIPEPLSGPVLALRALDALARYEQRVVLRRADGRIVFLETERWVEDPADAVRIALRERLLMSGRFRSVIDAAAAFESDYTVEGTLLVCDLVEGADGSRSARLGFRLLLAETLSGRVVHDGAHIAEVELSGDGNDGLGPAMTEALGEAAAAAVNAWPL